MDETALPLRDPRVPYCEGGGATCDDCRGSCGVEEYDDWREVHMRDLTDTGERLTVEELAAEIGVDLDG